MGLQRYADAVSLHFVRVWLYAMKEYAVSRQSFTGYHCSIPRVVTIRVRNNALLYINDRGVHH